MRRWLAVLLLVLLPFQFSWAAVASYCGHETGAAASHVGHHDHAGHGHAAKDADASAKGKTDGSAAGVSGLDCGHCHGHCAGLVLGIAAYAPPALAHAPSGLHASRRAEPMQALPERPQWAALA